MEIGKLENIVRQVLTEDENSRSNNDRLVYLVAKKINPNIDDFNARAILFNRVTEFPKYETVTRIRRKLQSEVPELKACKIVQEFREELEKEFIDYGRQ